MPKQSKKNLLIPFDSTTGNMISYPEYTRTGPTWKENCTFAGYLKFDGFTKGRSSVLAWLVSEEGGIRYPMFISEFEKVVRTKLMNDGCVKGEWTFCKRGANYSIALVA